ncbi:MAG: sulfatase-like hydrolase/transferase [Myxococcales bacterium]|nr:sulfatase-like hydrolase/transferase [Myxococcales bacterium]
MRFVFLSLALGFGSLAFGASCGDSAPSAGASQAKAKTVPLVPSERALANDDESVAHEGAQTKAVIDLADTPEVDLVANRFLWHLYRDGLLLPLASEGMRKYNHEYARPWKGNLKVAGTVGRVLAQRQSTLRFGWFDEVVAKGSVLRIRVHGLASGQRVSISLNGKTVANTNLAAEWQDLRLPVPAGVLRKGENALKLHVGKAGTASGAASYGLWHSIEVIGASTPITEEPGKYLEPVVGAGEALTGFSRMLQFVEVPSNAWLEFHTKGEGDFEVRLTDAKGQGHTIVPASPSQEERQQVSLEAFAGQLVRLEFLASPSGAWANPRIALKTAPSLAKPKAAENVILLVVDALRSDHVPLYESVYGKAAAVAMPNAMSRAAEGSVVFLNNQAASPSSPPSHGSIQTGMIPRVHGVDGDRGKLRAGTPMISTQAVNAGISAGYYGNNPFGMGRLEAPGQWTEFHQPGQEGKSNDCSTLVSMMLDFAKSQNANGKRFFISSLPYETHTPYRYHKGITENYYDGPWPAPVGQNVGGELLSAIASGKTTLSKQQWKQLKGLYRGEAEYWDQCFGSLVTGLSDAGLLEDTALVLTSDHGEGMFEHGRMGHAFGHYRELGDVPFVIFWKALGGGVRMVETVTSHRDIAPTVLDVLGVEPASEIQGQSVLPLAFRQAPWTERVVSLEYGRSYSIRSKRFKLIADYNGRQEIFDLVLDPWEKRDIKEGGAGAVRYLRDMAGFFLEYRSQWHYLEWGTLNNHRSGLLKAAKARAKAP